MDLLLRGANEICTHSALKEGFLAYFSQRLASFLSRFSRGQNVKPVRATFSAGARRLSRRRRDPRSGNRAVMEFSDRHKKTKVARAQKKKEEEKEEEKEKSASTIRVSSFKSCKIPV